MTVWTAYVQTWKNSAFVVPIFLAVRLLSLAVILPLMAGTIALAVALSGQQALTDQDIAYFIFTPVGAVALLGCTVIVLIGSVLGLAAMTVDLQEGGARGVAALWLALARIGARLPALAAYAVLLVLRILVIVLPFGAGALLVAYLLIGAFDINYYLATRPLELYIAGALIGLLLAVMACVLVSRLLLWTVSLHLVLFGGCGPVKAFAESAQQMRGKRMAVLRTFALWFAVRVVMTLVLGLIFGWMLRNATADLGSGFRLKLTLSVIIATIWTGLGLGVAALALGTLARLLNDVYGGAKTAPAPVSRSLSARGLLAGSIALVLGGLLVGGVLVRKVETDASLEIIAHRGAAGTRPENTLASIEKAIEDGADWVEIDVQETADGQIVVLHDSDFMKLAGVDLKIWEATTKDLENIDIGTWFDPDYTAERTPLLSDVLELIRDRAHLLIELKYYGHDVDLENRTIALVETAGLSAQVATMSLSYPAVQKMKRLRPKWPTGVLAATAVGNLAQLEGDFIAVNASMVNPKLIRATHRQNKKIYVWTVNDPLEMSAMMSMGVDGIITDEPALARSVIDIRTGLSTPERVLILFMERFDLTPPEKAYRDVSP